MLIISLVTNMRRLLGAGLLLASLPMSGQNLIEDGASASAADAPVTDVSPPLRATQENGPISAGDEEFRRLFSMWNRIDKNENSPLKFDGISNNFPEYQSDGTFRYGCWSKSCVSFYDRASKLDLYVRCVSSVSERYSDLKGVHLDELLRCNQHLNSR